MQWLAELCVRRPVFAAVLSLVVVVVGGRFYMTLGVDQFPKIDFPVVVVTTLLPGSSPADVEREITDKIEGAVNTISSIDELRSDSAEGISRVVVQFKLEKPVDVAVAEVQQKVNTVLGDLPRGVEPPSVQKVDPDAQPILFVALRGAGKEVRDLTDAADRVVRRRIESISGVGQVVIVGGRKRQVNVSVDPLKLKALGMSPLEVAQAINAQNITLPGGRVDTSRDYLTVRVIGRVESVEELKAVVLRDSAGRTIRLDEVAVVEDGVQDAETSASWNGDKTVVLAIRKQSGTNTVEVVDAVLARMKEFQGELPKGMALEVQRDQSQVVRTGTDAVKEHLVLGAIFAALVVLLFLGNLRSTVIAALAIPTSILGTFALMKLQGYTLNTITLLALALAVGIVIDDAIVVLENIYRLIEEKGMAPMKAAIEGTKEIGLAVMATTLSLIAVFLPIAFVAGVPGRFLAGFGVTMSFSIAVSLFISFTLTPMMASRWLGHRPTALFARILMPISNVVDPVFTKVVEFGYRPVERLYGRILAFCMRHRWVVVLASVAALASMPVIAGKAKKGFLPVDDRAQFEVLVRLPEGRSVAATELAGERVARIIRERKEVVATLVTVGDDASRTPNVARIYVKMTPPEARVTTQNEFKDIVRKEILANLPPDLKLTVADVNEFGGGQATAKIQYLVAGPELGPLERASSRIVAEVKKLPGAVDVDSTLVVGKPELGVSIDRAKAADLGVQVFDVAQALQYLVAGLKVSTYAEKGEQYEIRLRATPEYRSSEDALRLITVPSRKLGLVSLADVVTLHQGQSPTVIQRYQRERQITLLANAGPGTSEGALGESMKTIIEKEVAAMPPGYGVRPQGQTKLMKETGISFVLGLLASLLFMYLILAAQFESWLHPITILISLPLTLPFAMLSIVLFDTALDVYGFLGIFVLFGVVKKNAILQIDHTNQLREKGMPRLEAILQANKDRLRPILMTTLAFVAGMIPLVTAKGIGSGYNRATAGVVVGGQSLSLLLTLLAVPVAYSLFDDLAQAVGRRFGRKPEVAHVSAEVQS
jgi:hydrophobic/amphiphilic exporter-1 (mainly G- bacteria), HAE1 family